MLDIPYAVNTPSSGGTHVRFKLATTPGSVDGSSTTLVPGVAGLGTSGQEALVTRNGSFLLLGNFRG